MPLIPVTPYLDIDEAQVYFDGRLDSESWDEAVDADRLKALKTATELINNLRFVGQKVSTLQTNEFPRLGQVDIPDAIKKATCELALQLLSQADPNYEIENLAVSSDSYSMARSSYIRDFALSHIRAGIVSSEAWAYLLPYLADPLNIKLVRK